MGGKVNTHQLLHELGFREVSSGYLRMGLTQLTAHAYGVFASIHWPGGCIHLPYGVSQEAYKRSILEAVRRTRADLDAIIEELEQ